MPTPKLIIFERGKNPRELEILGDVVTFGRSADNSVSFAADSNISRYHAQIERRGDEFFVSDFGSSNGTTVNDKQINAPERIANNDKIGFGGDTYVQFVLDKKDANASDNVLDSAVVSASAANHDAGNHDAANHDAANSSAPKSKTLPLTLTAAAVLSGFAIVSVAVVAAVLWSDSGCTAEAAILSPESGATVSEATEIRLAVKNSKCVERVAFLLDGEEIAAAETAPYSTTLEPADFKPLVDDDSAHVLTVAVVDRDGKRRLQKDEILLQFAEPEKNAKKREENEPAENQPDEPKPPRESSAQVTIADIKTMSENLLKQFSGNHNYKFDQQFLREVQKRTVEYQSAGYSARANQYRDAINTAFVGEQGLDAPLGYVLAMSRSRFDNKKNQTNEGLWQMSPEFAESNGYNGQCGSETLSAAKQLCAARAAAIYSKALITNLFQGDVVYGVACFGLSPSEAGQFSVSLPPDRSDFWNNIKQKPQRDQIVNFFAAGIVAENPSKFNLKRDKPLSSLYKNLMILK